MKPLLPTLKERKRYLVYRLRSASTLHARADEAVLQHITSTLGLFDSARAGVKHMKYNQETQQGILRTTHTSVDKVRAALLLLQTINTVPVLPSVEHVTGILKKAGEV